MNENEIHPAQNKVKETILPLNTRLQECKKEALTFLDDTLINAINKHSMGVKPIFVNIENNDYNKAPTNICTFGSETTEISVEYMEGFDCHVIGTDRYLTTQSKI